MGEFRRPNRNKHYDDGPKAKLLSASSPLSHACQKTYCQWKDRSFNPSLYRSLRKEGHHKGNKRTSSTLLLSRLPSIQKRRKGTTYNKFKNFKPNVESTNVQNGNSNSNKQVHYREAMGGNNRPPRCIFPYPHSLVLPQVFCIHNRRKNLSLPIHAIRPFPSPMGVHAYHAANNAGDTQKRHHEFLPSGRFPTNGNLTCQINSKIKRTPRSISRSKNRGKLEKISINAEAKTRVPRSHIQFCKYDLIPSEGKNLQHSQRSPFYSSKSVLHKERIRVTNRPPKLCSIVPTIGKTPSASNNPMEQCSYKSKAQRPTSDPLSLVQKASPSMDKSLLSKPVSLHASNHPDNNLNDRREQNRMGRDMSAARDVRPMATKPQAQVYELPRVKSNPELNSLLCEQTKRQISFVVDGQHDSSSMHKKPRDLKGPRSPCSHEANTIKVQKTQNTINPQTPPRTLERVGGLSLSVQPNSWRVGSGRKHIQPPLEKSWAIPDRSLCKSIQCPDAPIHLPLPRSSSGGRECIFPGLEPVGLPIRLSTHEDPSPSGSKASPIQGPRDPNRSLSPSVIVVPQPPFQVPPPRSPPSVPSPVPNHREGNGLPPQFARLYPSRLETIKRGLMSVGVKEEPIDRVFNKIHKPSTIKQYQGVWDKFMRFLAHTQCDDYNVKIPIVIDFLFLYHDAHLREYRTITTYKCAIALPLKYALRLDIMCPTMDTYMKGLFAVRPPLKAKALPTWSLDGVLKYLKSDVFEPLEEASDSHLIAKTLFLILLSSGRRISEITNLSTASFKDDHLKRLKLEWLENFRPKHFTANFRPECPSIGELKLPDGSSDLLCPVRALTIYLFRMYKWRDTKSPGGTLSPLWMNPVDKTKYSIVDMSKIFNNLISDYREYNHLDKNIQIGPHGVRKLAGAICMAHGVDLIYLAKIMGFSTPMIMKKNYGGKAPHLSVRCNLPGGVYPINPG